MVSWARCGYLIISIPNLCLLYYFDLQEKRFLDTFTLAKSMETISGYFLIFHSQIPLPYTDIETALLSLYHLCIWRQKFVCRNEAEHTRLL